MVTLQKIYKTRKKKTVRNSSFTLARQFDLYNILIRKLRLALSYHRHTDRSPFWHKVCSINKTPSRVFVVFKEIQVHRSD